MPNGIAAHWFAIASEARLSGRIADAVHAFQQALTAAPLFADGWFDFGQLLRRCGQPKPALEAFHRSLELGLQAPEEAMLEIALVHSELLLDDDAAESALRKAIAQKSDYIPALINLGNLAEDFGRREEAESLYRAARQHTTPNTELALTALARLLEVAPERFADEALDAIRETLAASEASPERANLGFALGRHLERKGDIAGAFQTFIDANRDAMSGHPPYDSDKALSTQQAIINALTQSKTTPLVKEMPSYPAPSLFLVGLFRSGSTLLEQMLAAHPAIDTIGESSFIPRIAARLGLADMLDLDAERTVMIAGAYRKHIERMGHPTHAKTAWIIDKRPDNIERLPLLRRLCPTSRIIVTRREPHDNGLSVFQHHLDLRHAPYAGDLSSIGHHIVLHQELVTAASGVLGDALRIVDYEALVAEPEAVLRPLLAWLGLDWAPECLEFHRRPTAVRTASVWQVREPLHARACGRWHAYAEHLQPLITALRQPSAGIPKD